MSELATAYVNIVPSAQGIKGKLTSLLGGETASAGASAGSVFGGSLVGTLTKVVAAAGIGKMVSDAVSKGADLEQSIGGIETLFGTGGAKSLQEYADQVGKTVGEVSKEYTDLSRAQEQMVQYANEAYRTAGLSANDYMQTVTSFAASLKQSTGGDMRALTTAANQAVIDMSDNANKMGTDMQSIQNAYQGFAKQNYTMLDNLKLGYGGTKSEMERLLADAEKLSGQKYDMDNLSDVYSAIHVVQEELGITGTTSKEAAQTISGSLASMKAAFDNVLAKITLGEDISDELNALVETVVTFTQNNLVPALGNIVSALPGAMKTLFDKAYPIISELVGNLFQKLPQIISDRASMMTEMFSTILDGLIGSLNDGSAESGASSMAETLLSIVSAAIDSVVTMATTLAPKLWELATTLIGQLWDGLVQNAPALGDSASSIISEFLSGIQEQLPTLLEQGVGFITNIANGILEALPTLIASAGQIIVAFVEGIVPMLPTILQQGLTLVLNLIDGILSALPSIGSAVIELVSSLLSALADNFPQIIATGIEMIAQLIGGMISGLVKLGNFVNAMKSQLKEKIRNIDWKKLGSDILDGIIAGLKAGAGRLGDAFKGLISGLTGGGNGEEKASNDKGKANGKALANGMADGIRQNGGLVRDAMRNLEMNGTYNRVVGSVQSNSNISVGQARQNAIGTLERRLDALSESLETYSSMVASGRSVNVTLQGDAKTMFKAIQRENNIYRTSTGRSVFA